MAVQARAPGALDAAVADQRHLREASGALAALVGPPAAEGAGQRLHGQRLGIEPPALLAPAPDHAPAQVHEDLGDVDLHRADLVARPAQGGRVGQRRRPVHALELGVRIAPIGPG